MIDIYKKYVVPLIFFMACITSAHAQTQVSGTVKDTNGDPVPGANILVKGTTNGTAADGNGEFSLTVNNIPPFTIVITAVSHADTELVISGSSPTSGIEIVMSTDETILGEVVVSGFSQKNENWMKGSVTLEPISQLDIQQAPAFDFYNMLQNTKGIQMTTSSFNFPQINTRGFATISNVRFVQLVDWMDVSAPLLNFPTGNIVGLSELDVESMELIPGASSAIYGPNAFNGTLIMTSKNPFEYQGLSAQAKVGLTTSDAQDNEVFPMYNFNLRYAKAFNNKFAFKVNFAYMAAKDWYGNDYKTDRVRSDSQTDLSGRPDFDGLNLYGDEIEIPTGVPSIGTIHRTGFKEGDILDNRDAKSIKGDVALHYKINDKIEASYMYRYGGGSSVYQGSQKYALRDFTQQFHKLELRGSNFFVRGYATITGAGDSYNVGALGTIANEYVSGTENVWAPDYVVAMQGYIPGVPAGDHDAARAFADRTRPEPGTPAFKSLMDQVRNNYFQRNPPGAKFKDASRLYHAAFQYEFDKIEFMEVLVGGNVRQYNLFSDGTIFNENPEESKDFKHIIINEYGFYGQVAKDINGLKLTGTLRYDKNENFDGHFTPRVSAVYSFAQNARNSQHIRASFQTGFRNPDSQAQYIFFNVGTNTLLGSTEDNAARYHVHNGGAYTFDSYQAFLATGGELNNDGSIASGDETTLVTADIPYVKPEQLKAFELGYKAVTGQGKVLFDVSGYYTSYTDFIGSTYIASKESSVHQENVLDAGTIFTPYYNSPAKVNSWGYSAGLTYNLPFDGFQITATYDYANFKEESGQDPNFRAFFNTPKNKYNAGLNYNKRDKNYGFSLNFHYQDAALWESDFGTGMIGSYGLLDAMVNYKLTSMQSILKLGATNIGGKDYRTNFGGPFVGRTYYVSITFNPMLFK